MKRSPVCLLATLASIIPSVALAHTGAHTSGFAHGFAHPISGLDHVLAMVMVGLFAYQLGGRALWIVPLAFVSAMSVGGALRLAGIGVPFIEIGIALSVIVLGALVASNARTPVIAAVAMVGFFAIFHGYAHGAEMPANAAALTYAIAFLIATALLHLTGAALGLGIDKAGQRTGSAFVRVAGAFGLVAGLGIFTGIL